MEEGFWFERVEVLSLEREEVELTIQALSAV
jgi:hypothetical protein